MIFRCILWQTAANNLFQYSSSTSQNSTLFHDSRGTICLIFYILETNFNMKIGLADICKAGFFN